MEGISLEQRDQINQYILSDLGLTTEVVAEVAGANIAALAWQRWSLANQSVGVLVGSGRTGLIALIATRRLLAWGGRPTVHLGTPRDTLSRLNQAEVDRFEVLGGRVFEPGAPLPAVALWIDGLFGTGFRDELSDELKDLIDAVNHDHSPTLAIDLPSGLDATTGKASLPAIRADVTAALGLPMVGILKPFAKQLVGEIAMIDLGIPASVWRRFGVTDTPNFDGRPFVHYS